MRKTESLSDLQLSIIKLIKRSPKDHEGWSDVSKGLVPLVSRLPQDVVEIETEGREVARCRLRQTVAYSAETTPQPSKLEIILNPQEHRAEEVWSPFTGVRPLDPNKTFRFEEA